MLSKNSFDTKSDFRGSFFVSPKPTLISSWHISGTVQRLKDNGTVMPNNEAIATGSGILHSAPSLIESVYLLHGNDSG